MARRGADPLGRKAADEALAHEITVIHLGSRGTYGVPRIHAELCRLGRRVNRKRVARLMREHGIQGAHRRRRRRRRSLTRPDKKAKPALDLIGRDFHAEIPGTKMVGDITALPTGEGWLYLACWLDLATREVVGYSMADHHRADLVVDALTMAAGRGQLRPGCIAHSDRGSEYTGPVQSPAGSSHSCADPRACCGDRAGHRCDEELRSLAGDHAGPWTQSGRKSLTSTDADTPRL
ncbi:IS3 family transposase [Streptomyces olivoreticuli]